MNVLDTNVPSDFLRLPPAPHVDAWLAAQDGANVHFATVSEVEQRYGVATLPASHRSTVHGAAIDGMLDEDFRGRSLPFCCSAASACALIPITRRAAGRPISQFDCRISAIASARSANVPTRYTGDYDGCGLEMIDPWHSKGNR